MEQCPRKRKPLALAAGKIRGTFQKRRVQPLISPQEVGQLYTFQDCPQLPFRRIRLSHIEIIPDSTFK